MRYEEQPPCDLSVLGNSREGLSAIQLIGMPFGDVSAITADRTDAGLCRQGQEESNTGGISAANRAFPLGLVQPGPCRRCRGRC